MKTSNKYKKKNWEEYYKGERLIHIKPKTGLFASYDIYLCDMLFQKYLPKYNGPVNKKPKICEIGCGDGKLLKKVADMLGYEPYGIEYSKTAIKSAKKLGIKIIEGDAFDKKILKKYTNHFDIVFSYGFIEHIIPPDESIDIHIKMLKKGGRYIIQIPRFKGFNLWKVKLFRPDLIPLHNMEIMDEKVMNKICKRTNTQKLYCKNYGTLKLRLVVEKKNINYYILQVLGSLEYVTNPLLRLFFGKKGFETNFFSPAVMYVGKKK